MSHTANNTTANAKPKRARKVKQPSVVTPVPATLPSKWQPHEFSQKMNSYELKGWAIDNNLTIDPVTDRPSLMDIIDTIGDHHPEYDALFALYHKEKAKAKAFNISKWMSATKLDSVIRASVWRSLANSAVIRGLSTLTGKIQRNEPTMFSVDTELALYRLALENIPPSNSPYDQPMEPKAALILLMTDRVPADELIEILSDTVGLSRETLKMIATAESKSRTAKFRTYGSDAMDKWNAGLAGTFVEDAEKALSPVEVQHRTMLSVIRALDKTRQSTLKRILNTGALDQLGVFVLCDAAAMSLYNKAQDFEIEFSEELMEAGTSYFSDNALEAYQRTMPMHQPKIS